MNGFWAAIPPWAWAGLIVMFMLLVAGLMFRVGLLAGREQGYEERIEDEAEARRTHPVYRERRTSTAAFLHPPEVAHEDFAMAVVTEEARRAWEIHAGQALAVVREPGYAAAGFDVDAIIAGFHAEADAIIAVSEAMAARADRDLWDAQP